jgi:hypothetical protein
LPTTRTESARLSPLAAELVAGSALVMIEPPSRSIALSKDQARSRAGLEKQRRQDGIGRNPLAAADAVFEPPIPQFVEIGLGDLEYAFDLAVREAVDRHEVAC